LLRRAAQERCLDARRENAAALHDELSAAAFDARMRAPAADVLLSGAYLIARDQIDDFRRRVQRISGVHPDMRIVATGPWPPHHFVPALQLKEHCHA